MNVDADMELVQDGSSILPESTMNNKTDQIWKDYTRYLRHKKRRLWRAKQVKAVKHVSVWCLQKLKNAIGIGGEKLT